MFGFALGGIAFVVGYAHGLLATQTDTLPWRWLAIGGAAAITATVVLPSLWARPELAVRTVATAVQRVVLLAILALTYVTVVWPIGAVLRRTTRRSPVYEWDSMPPEVIEGWREKTVETSGRSRRSSGRPTAIRLAISMMSFFLRRRQVWLVPAILLFVVLGLLFFFVQSSVIAPFIYPLF